MLNEATLNFRRVTAKGKCLGCGEEFDLAQDKWRCPRCGEWRVDILSGKEFYIDSIEVD